MKIIIDGSHILNLKNGYEIKKSYLKGLNRRTLNIFSEKWLYNH